MPKTVLVPEVGRVHFGDDMNEHDIGLAVQEIVKQHNSQKGPLNQIGEGIGQLWNDAPAIGRGLMDQGQMLAEGLTGHARFQPDSASQQMAAGVVHDTQEEGQAAIDFAKKGDYTQALGHGLAAVPFVGKPAAQIAQEVTEGNYGKGAAHALELFAPEILHTVLPRTGRIGPIIHDVRNSTEAAAVNSVRPRVRTSAGQRTGNIGVQRVEKQLANLPGSSHRAHEFYNAQEQELAEEGRRITNSAGAYRTNEVGTGRAVDLRLRDRFTKLKSQADRMYDKVRAATSANKVAIQTGSKATGLFGPKGQPLSTPIISVLEAPTDIQPMRSSLQSIHTELESNMPEVKRLNSPAFKALDNLMKSDKTHMSAMDFDKFLGALKSISREGKNPYLTSQSQALAMKMVNEGEATLDRALRSAGPSAASDLRSGRNIVKAYYETGEILNDLDNEPSKIYKELSSRGDVKDNLLSKLKLFAPKEMQLVGRTYLEEMMQKATREGGFDRAAGIMQDWNNLGDEAKDKFYGRALTQRIDKFTLAAKKLRNPLGPGTAHFMAALGAAGGLTLAVIGAATGHFQGAMETVATTIALPNIAARLLMTEEGARLMTEVITLPVKTPAWKSAAVALSAKITHEIRQAEAERQQNQQPQAPQTPTPAPAPATKPTPAPAAKNSGSGWRPIIL